MTTSVNKLRSPKNKFIAEITFPKYVKGIGGGDTIGAMNIEDVKDLAQQLYKKFTPHVVIKENKKEYPEFDWRVIEEYNL